jgi:predicted metalloprotease with PDZ domain
LGLRTNLENGKTIVKYINSKSCSYLGGINVKDELISINGIAVKDNADDVLQALDDKNTALTVMVVRSGLLKEIRMDYHPLNYQDWSFIKPKETPLSKIFFRD